MEIGGLTKSSSSEKLNTGAALAADGPANCVVASRFKGICFLGELVRGDACLYRIPGLWDLEFSADGDGKSSFEELSLSNRTLSPSDSTA